MSDSGDPGSLGSPGTVHGCFLPPSVLLWCVLLGKAARAMRALEMGVHGCAGPTHPHPGSGEGTCPVNGVVPLKVTGPLECLPAGVAFEGRHLGVGDAVSLKVRHVLEDPNAHRTAVALFLNRSPIGPGLPLCPLSTSTR